MKILTFQHLIKFKAYNSDRDLTWVPKFSYIV